jgi:hypothetical protein
MLCRACRSKELVFRPAGEPGNRNSGRPGANGREVLKMLRADSLAPSVSRLVSFNIEIVTPSPDV